MTPAPDPVEASRMTLGEHLDELRTRLFRGVLAVVAAFAIGWTFHEPITALVMRPFDDSVAKINAHWTAEYGSRIASDPSLDPLDYFTSPDPATRELLPSLRAADRPTILTPAEAFLFILKVSLYFALLVGGPVLLWQLWQFIAAGLYAHERKAALRYFPYSVALFLLGVLFGYFVLIPNAMYYLGIALEPSRTIYQVRLQNYFTLLTSLSLALAAVFQLPVLMTFFARLGLVEAGAFSRYRGHFIVAAFVLSAIITPPDPFTQCLMAVPMLLLYQVGVWAAKLGARPRRVPGDRAVESSS